MISRFAAAAVIVALASPAIAATDTSKPTSTYKLLDGRSLVVSAASIDGIGPSSTKLVLSGKSHVKVFDKAANSTLDASADKIVVTLSGKSDVGATSGIKSADLVGSPQVICEAQDRVTGRVLRTTATSTSATYDGATDTFHLKGNVKMISEDPKLFDGPAEMTGDEAWVHVGNLGPDDVRFRISSSPGVSTITATPKSKEETKPKK